MQIPDFLIKKINNEYNEEICKKIKNLEITPAMLALDPCSGSIVVTNPNNGTVKAMTSYPSYDNNRLTNMIDADYYSKITTDKTTPMYSRATMQQRPVLHSK